MSSHPSTSKKSYKPNLSKITGGKKGKLNEIISLLTLAKKGYELSIDENTKFRDFSVGREIGIGKDRKFDDVVFSYVDQEITKNLIFLQLKHCQYYIPIDSCILSTEADIAKYVAAKAKALATRVEDVRYGNMHISFNLQQYFISFLSVRDELKNTNTEELKGGKIKNVVLFTNVELNRKELEERGFSFKKAPGDIVDLFTLSSETQHYCHQLEDVSEGLHKILKKSSDLDRLAKELARHVVCEDYRENIIMGSGETPSKYYHVALEREVIQKSPLKQVQNEQHFCEAQFREDFLDCDETAPNQHQLRKALFEAIRQLDESKKDADDNDLKNILEEAKWKIVYKFEKNKQKFKTDFPCEWIPVTDEDIKDFLRCFVFIVNQPRVSEFELLYQRSMQSVVVLNTSLKQFVDQINDTGQEFRDYVERLFGLDFKPHNDEKWISCNQIEDFINEKQQLLRIIFVVSTMTLMYKNEIMQYGKFNNFGKIMKNVKNFLTSDCKLLYVKTPVTLLSSIKISQHLNTEKNYPISISLNILNCTENRDCVLKAFELESIRLLTIECRHAFKDHDINFLDALFKTAKENSNKQIILIMQLKNFDICTKRFKTDFQEEEICVIENYSIDLKDFEPKEDPLAKNVLVFQGQTEKVSLSDITGINSWSSYVDNLSERNSEEGIVDGMALVDILSNDEIEVGSKPAGTSSLEGAYVPMYEEINMENLVNKLTSQERGNDAKDMYIISGISASSKQEKTDKVIQYLGLNNKKEIIENQLGDISSDSKIKIADDQFKDKDFQNLCHSYPEKRIFWISVKCENDVMKLILQEAYNPKFYLKRKFKNVTIKKDLKEHLIKADLSETFIFHCEEDEQELYKSMELNEPEIEQFENNYKIRLFFQKSDAEVAFRELRKENETVHFLEFKEKQFLWCESHGSVKYLQKFIDHKRGEQQSFDHDRSEILLIEEDKLIEKIKDRKVVIFADDPGMGKTTSLIKLYETEIESCSIIKSHWVINIKLRDHLEAVFDHAFERDGIDILGVIEFLSTIDLKLNNNLAKNLLKFVLDKSKRFQTKPLLLIFDGFDEVLDEDRRHRILLLLQFIKDKTAAKMWVTTRCHFKKLLEQTLSTIAIEFNPMDDAENAQYISTYLKHCLYLILNKDKYTDVFDTEDENQINEKIHMYTEAFINKMKSIFRGDISTFIGTPLQLYLLLEHTVRDFKNWIEGGEDQISVFKYARSDVWDAYEYFINRKYDVYFLKIGIRERKLQGLEKCNIDRYHKDFAVSKILEENRNDVFEQFKDVFLLVGIIKSQESELEFIHKTFEEFFASKVFIDWIKKPPNTNKQEYLLKVIFMKPNYQLVRTFINLQLQKLSEQNEFDKSLKHYEIIAEKLILNEENENWTPLHITAKENNKNIASFLLSSLKKPSDVLEKFLFITGKFTPDYGPGYEGTALHLACMKDDLEIVKLFLDAAERISKVKLEEFLKLKNAYKHNALDVAVQYSHNVQILNELLNRTNNKLDLILDEYSALCIACYHKKDEFVKFLLQEFKHDKHSLKDILLYKRDVSPLHTVVNVGHLEITKVLLETALDINDDKRTLKQLLSIDRSEESALHIAAERGRGDIIKLLLEKTASALGIEVLEKLITAVNKKGKNAIQLMVENGHEEIFYDSFKILKDEYPIIWKKTMEIFDNVPLEIRLYWGKKKLIMAIESGDIKSVKYILSSAKNSSGSTDEILRILLLAEGILLEQNFTISRCTLHLACIKGNSEIVKELLFYAKEIEDDNPTLKKLLSIDIPEESALHVAAKRGHGNIIKLILETASSLGIEVLEKLINAVDDEDKNAIQLMVEHGHEAIFAESFKMLEEEKYSNIRKSVQEMFKNVPLESKLYKDKKEFIAAIKRGDIKRVKDILISAKNVSVSPNKSLRILLLDNDMWENNALHLACIKGNSEIIKELISYAIEIEDDNEALKELLSIDIPGESALHVVAKRGRVDIIKLILETASSLGIDVLEKLITAGNYDGKNAIQLMVEHGHEAVFAESFKILEKDKYSNIRKTVMGTFENVQLEIRHNLDKESLIKAIESGDIKRVKNILSTAKNSSGSPNESLRILLLAEGIWSRSTLYLACVKGNLEIIKELFFYGKQIEDDNRTLKELLSIDIFEESVLHVAARRGRGDSIKLILETASSLGVKVLEKLITAVDYKDRNAIQLMVKHDHEAIFEDSFKLLKDEYPIIWKKAVEIFHNVKLETRLYLEKKNLIMAIESGDIKRVKDILFSAKNVSVSPNKSLRILLLDNDMWGNNALHLACVKGNSEIIKELISYAIEIEDDNETLKQLLSIDIPGESALHVVAERGRVDIIKLILETASSLGIDVLEKLITAGNYDGKNAIQLMVEHGHEAVFAESFKILEKDKYSNIRKTVMGTFENVQLEIRHYLDKKSLITAIESGDSKRVKDILSSAKNSSGSPNESLRILLLAEGIWSRCTLHLACVKGNLEIIKELFFYAKQIEDDNRTLKEILSIDIFEESVLHVAARQGRGDSIKLILETASSLGPEIMEKLIIAVDYEDRNAIQLMVKHDHEAVFEDFFKMLKDEYPIIWKKAMEIFNNLPLKTRLYWDKKKLIRAIQSGDIKRVKDILSSAKNSSGSPNESLRILLLAKGIWSRCTLHLACVKGNSEIIKELLFYAKEIEDDNRTLKQLLSIDIFEESALHVAAERGRGNIIKLILETASSLGVKVLEKLITAVDYEDRNAIQLMVKHDHEAIFEDSFKMLKDEYPIIWKKAVEIFHNVKLETRLYLEKKNLITAIESGDIKRVKDILSSAKNSSISQSKSLRILLLDKDMWGNNALHLACVKGNLEIIKELLSYAKEIEDDNRALKQLLSIDICEESALHVAAERGRFDIIKLLLETASDFLDIETIEKLVFAENKKRKIAIQLMVEHGHEKVFAESFKILKEDKYSNIQRKVTEMYSLYLAKKKLISAVGSGEIKEVKDILSNAENCTDSLRILLLADENPLELASDQENSEMIKEILSCAMNMDDRGTTLNELLTSNSLLRYFETHSGIRILESLILESKNDNKMDAVNILKEFKEQCIS